MRLRRVVLAPGMVLALLVAPALTASPAAALSCVGPDLVLAKAQSIFTGRIVDGEPGKVLVEVDEIWRGDPVQSPLWLTVQLEGWSPWSGRDGTIPEGFSSPKTWLFVPEGDYVNPCSSWPLGTISGATVAENRPDSPVTPIAATPDVRPAAAVPRTEDRRGWVIPAGLAGLVALAAAAAVAIRRRAGAR